MQLHQMGVVAQPLLPLVVEVVAGRVVDDEEDFARCVALCSEARKLSVELKLAAPEVSAQLNSAVRALAGWIVATLDPSAKEPDGPLDSPGV